MDKHPYFDLWLHSNDELSGLLSQEIIERTTVHEWPLSCVQYLKLADGNRLIYKSQFRATTVETEFLSTIQNDEALALQLGSLLPRAGLLRPYENCVFMTLEYIDSPRLEEQPLAESAILDHGERLLSELHLFPLNLPVYTDIDNRIKWTAYTQETISMLDNLIRTGQFHLTSNAAMRGLMAWAQTESVLNAIDSPPALNHHDLSGDNVFITPEGYKIIDWQRPVRGPADLDRVCYLIAMDIDPFRFIQPSYIALFWFLRIRWLVECKANWFPVGEIYDRQVAELADQIIQL